MTKQTNWVRRTFNAAAPSAILICCCLQASPAQSQAMSMESYIDKRLKSTKACQKILQVNMRESDARQAQLKRIPEDDHAALCRYGRKVGQPGLVKALERFKQSKTCDTTDTVISALIESASRVAEQNRQAVDRDCAQAGL